MSYVETSHPVTTTRVPSILADMHKAHMERVERIKAAAYAERVKEAAEIDDQQVAILERSWEERRLPPIPNAAIAAAAAIGQPRIIRGQVETILRAVLVHFPNVNMNDLKSARRTDKVVRPRQIAMYLVKELTSRTLPDIGRRMGDRDHTTVLYAVRKIAAEIKVNPELSELIKKIKATIEEPTTHPMGNQSQENNDAPRCLGCGWLYRRPEVECQHDRMFCRACESKRTA